MDMRRNTILIVDDTELNRLLLEEILKSNYDTVEACSGAAALQMLQQPNRIDLILLDLLMPDMDGYAVLEKLRSDEATAGIPVIIITSFEEAEAELRALDLGATDLIRKPFDPRIVIQRIKNCLLQRETEKIRMENKLLREQTQAQIQLKAIMDNLTGGIILLEVGDTFRPLYMSKGFFALRDHREADSDAYQANIFHNVHPEDMPNLLKAGQDAVQNQYRQVQCDYRVLRTKRLQWLHMQAVQIPYPDSSYPVLLCIITDITDLQEAKSSLASTAEQLTMLMDNIPGGIAVLEVTETAVRARYCNAGFLALSGKHSTNEAADIEEDVFSAIWEEDLPFMQREFRKIRMQVHPLTLTFRIRHSDGGFCWVRMKATPISSDSENPQFYAILIDISKEKQQEEINRIATEQLQFRALHDVLTTLYNRDGFCTTVQRLLDHARVAPAPERYGIALWNLQRFKIVNDLFGKDTGDMLLKEMAGCIRAYFENEEADIVIGRLSGDHFVSFSPMRCLNPQAMLQHASNRLSSLNLQYPLSVNLSLYEIDDLQVPVQLMCDRANLALQTIQDNYDKRYVFYDASLRKDLMREQEIVACMQNALTERQFVIYLQPVYSLANYRPISAEALVRWIHPTLGFISPGAFIPVFEKNGFISKLDAYVWEETCRYLRGRLDAGQTVVPISVNASRRSLYNPNLCEEICALVKKYHLSPDLLKFEITESAYTSNPEQILQTTSQLRAAGFAILMDDFGSGYSSLNTLKDITVDILKIDMKFMADFDTNERAGSILTSVVRMARWLRLPVIAEGVELESQVRFLKSIGCDRIQGYFFSKPLPIPEFNALLLKGTEHDTLTETDTFDLNKLDALFNSEICNELLQGITGAFGVYAVHEDTMEAIRVNEAYCTLFGYHPQAFYVDMLDIFRNVHPEDQAALLKTCHDIVAQKSSAEIYVRRFHQDGHAMFILASLHFLGDSADAPVICASFRDLSNVVLPEQDLQHPLPASEQAKQIVRKTIDKMPCGILLQRFEVPAEPLSCNPALLELFGFSDFETFRRVATADLCCVIHASEVSVYRNALQTCIDTQETVAYQLHIHNTDGSMRYVICWMYPVTQANGKPAIQNVICDATEVSRTQQIRSFRQFKQILFSVFDAVYALDFTVNKILLLASKDPDAEIGQVWSMSADSSIWADTLVHPEDAADFLALFHKHSLRDSIAAQGAATVTLRVRNRNDQTYQPLSLTFMLAEGNNYFCCVRSAYRPRPEERGTINP